MTRIALAVAAAVSTVVLTAGQALPGGGAPRARVVAADRQDLSRPLRDLPTAAFRHEEHEREPGPWRRVDRSRKLTFDPVAQNYPDVALMPAPSQSIEGINNINGVLPPDTNGDVGPDHYVQAVNLSIAVYSKGTSTTPPALLYGPVPGNTLWTGFGGPCEARTDGDPIVLYDHLADRWLVSQLALPNSFFGLLFSPFYQCIAVSATPDPTGAYYRYQFPFMKLNDYPKLAVWPDGYYMAINQFTAISIQFAGQGVVAFDRVKMLAGLPASMIYFDLAPVDITLGGMLPADLDGPAPPPDSPAYFMEVDDDAAGATTDQLQLWRFLADWTNPSSASFSRAALLPTAPFDSNLCDYARNCIPQPATSIKIDAIADRLMNRLQYRNFGTHESLVVNHTVDVDGTDHAGIRWYEIRDPGTAPSIYQQSTFAPDADHRWMASAASDGMGNIALGFSVSGATTFPSIRYTGRLASDPPGSMTQGETDLIVGSGSQTHASGRWGDYSMLAVDPRDDCTFWYTQEYYSATSAFGWQTRIGSFAFPSCASAPAPLGVSITATAPTATEFGPTNGVFTVTRAGDASAPLTVLYDVLGTATPDSDYISLPRTVTFVSGASAATIVVTPIDDVVVEANETVIVRLKADAAYRVGSPSEATVSIVSDDVLPDLIVTAVTAPAVAGAGSAIAITDTTKDQGAGPAGASATGFYLSTNTLLDQSDLFLGQRPAPQLAAGASDSAPTTLTIPAGTATGTYFVVAVADFDKAIAETQEANNTKPSGAVRIGPDLLVTALTAPAAAAAGGTLAVTDATANQGGGNAVSSTTSFYLSANATLDASDIVLGSRTVPALAPGTTDSASTPLTVPPGTAAGLWYVIAKADASSVVAETQELNNVKFSAAVKIGPDLIVSAVSVPPIAGAGATIVVTDTTKNQGAAPADSSTTVFYLSANLTLEPSDVFLASRVVPRLAAGVSDSAPTTVQVPAGTATGTYFVIAKADNNGVLPESVESNNTLFSFGIRVGPDLTVSSLTAPASAAAGAAVVVSDTTKNVGGGGAPASTTQFYLSSNGTFDAGDILLGARAVAPLVPGGVDSGSVTLTIPAGTAAATYFIIAVGDGPNGVVEANETNNTRPVAVKVTP
jgi:subtilase family serine protease